MAYYYTSSETVDYIGIQTLVTLPLTESKVCFNVTILSDELPESEEIFSIVVFPSGGVMTNRRDRINIIIEDAIIGK